MRLRGQGSETSNSAQMFYIFASLIMPSKRRLLKQRWSLWKSSNPVSSPDLTILGPS